MAYYDITGNVLSYFTDRKQQVVVNGAESKWSCVIRDVPEGSVIGSVYKALGR